MSVPYHKYLSIGPGGRRCVCCFPAPRSDDRRKQFRRAKKKAEREAVRNAMADYYDELDFIQQLQADLAAMDDEFRYEYDPFEDLYDAFDLYMQEEDEMARRAEYLDDDWYYDATWDYDD